MSKPSGILTVPYFDTLDPFNLEEAIKDPISYMEDRIDKMFEDAWTLMTFKRLWKQQGILMLKNRIQERDFRKNDKNEKLNFINIMTTQKKSVVVKQFDIETVDIAVSGVSPLIMHKFSEKSRKQIEDKQQKKATTGKEARNPEEEYLAAIHLTTGGKPGFPASGVKKALVRAAKYNNLVMKDIQCNLFVEPNDPETDLIEISGKHSMRTDHVGLSNGNTDIRYRPEFKQWKATLTISYNKAIVSLDQVMTMVEAAGYGVGIGDWRPERGGNYGRFTLKKAS